MSKPDGLPTPDDIGPWVDGYIAGMSLCPEMNAGELFVLRGKFANPEELAGLRTGLEKKLLNGLAERSGAVSEKPRQ